MNTRRYAYWMLGAALLIPIAAATPGTTQADGPTATYEVIFVPSWNPESHPADYPITHGKKGLLTPLIGATHGKDFQLFATGTPPTAGLERLSEMGAHDPLDAEIQTAVADGKAGSLIQSMEASPGPVHPIVTNTFQIDEKFPMVSLAGMIAPSPDWFYGVSNVELFQNGRWVTTLHMAAYAHDSGGDAGSSYMAEDADENPKKPTRILDNSYFGKRAPVGTFIFKLVPSSTES